MRLNHQQIGDSGSAGDTSLKGFEIQYLINKQSRYTNLGLSCHGEDVNFEIPSRHSQIYYLAASLSFRLKPTSFFFPSFRPDILIWDYGSSATDTISGGVTRSREIVGGATGKVCAAAPELSGALKNTRDLTKVASETAVWTSQAVVERMPDREGWQRIGRLGLRIADYAVDQGSKPFTGESFTISIFFLSNNPLL